MPKKSQQITDEQRKRYNAYDRAYYSTMKTMVYGWYERYLAETRARYAKRMADPVKRAAHLARKKSYRERRKAQRGVQ